MLNPNPESNRSKKRVTRGVSIAAPYLNSRKHHRAAYRMGVACVHSGPNELIHHLAPGGKFQRKWNLQECRGGGSRKMW